jgi:hypothetical protein
MVAAAAVPEVLLAAAAMMEASAKRVPVVQ